MLVDVVAMLVITPIDRPEASVLASASLSKDGKVRPKEDDATAAGKTASRVAGVGSEARDHHPIPQGIFAGKQFEAWGGERRVEAKSVCEHTFVTPSRGLYCHRCGHLFLQLCLITVPEAEAGEGLPVSGQTGLL